MNDSTVVPSLVGSEIFLRLQKDKTQAGLRVKQRVRNRNPDNSSTDNRNIIGRAHPEILTCNHLSRWGLNILDASKSAAQRRKNVATAAGRGLWCCGGMSPFRGERVTSRDTFRRTPFRTSSTTRSTPPEMFCFDDVQLDS